MLLPALEAELVLDGCGRHWGGAMIVNSIASCCGAWVRLWHETDLPTGADDVRCWE